jgi:hypothetical protein
VQIAPSQGLAAWFHNCDKVNTTKEFKLRPEQRVLFAQALGFPAKTSPDPLLRLQEEWHLL